jgi:hypothetical protein
MWSCGSLQIFGARGRRFESSLCTIFVRVEQRRRDEVRCSGRSGRVGRGRSERVRLNQSVNVECETVIAIRAHISS